MFRGTPIRRMEIIGTEESSCIKINHNQLIGRGTREYCLSSRENILGNRDYRIPEDWDRTWTVGLGPAWTPEELGTLNCWFQPEYFHPWTTTSTTTETSQPDEGTAIDTMFHNGLSSTSFATNAEIQVGNSGGTRVRTAMVWDLTELPSTAVITSATLTLTEHTDEMTDEQTIRIQRITQAITEVGTWNTYDGTNAWTTTGGDYSTDIISDTTTSGGTLTVNNAKFVELCQDAIDNRSSSLKILIATVYELTSGTVSGTQRMKYNSSSDSTDSDDPKLVVTYTDSGGASKIYRAEDRTGSYNAEQNDDDNSLPALSSGAELLNEHKGIKFTPHHTWSDYMTIPDSSVGTDFDCGEGGGAGSSNFFGAMVVNVKGTVNSAGNYVIFSKGGANGISVGVNDTAEYLFFMKCGGTSFVADQVASADGLFIVVFSRSSTTHKIFVNGVEEESTSTASLDIDSNRDVYFGTEEISTEDRFGNLTYGVPTAFWDGILYEFMWNKGSLTDANRQKIEGYLAHKFGLTGKLASDHPYKSNPERAAAAKEATSGSMITLATKMSDRAAKTAGVSKNYTT